MTDRENFEKVWNKFAERIKGKLLTQKEKGNLTYPVLKLTLADAVLAWDNKFNECGRWLIEYSKGNPEKGELIREILLKDMKFTEISVKKSNTRNAALLTSVGAAAVGFGVSYFLHANTAVTVAATILPMIATYPAVTATSNISNSKKETDALEAYMNQLEKFRISVANVIEK